LHKISAKDRVIKVTLKYIDNVR